MTVPMVGSYRILEKIGEGTFGQVFAAEHVILGRKTALKLLKPSGSPEELQRRIDLFIREARILSRFDDEHIVRIYDFFPEESSGLWIAMEFIEGVNLLALIQDPSWSLSDAAQLFYEMVEGVEALHSQGVVHRDLKPANFLIEANTMNVKVTDFGIAFSWNETDLMTGFQGISGTLPFMPPEQFEAEPMDHRGDIWSLGVILYFLISGKLPFQSDTQMQMIKRIYSGEYPMLSRDDFPRWACEIIDSTLRPDPDDRLSTCREMLKLIPIVHGSQYKATRDLNREELLNAVLKVLPDRGVEVDREMVIKEASRILGIERVGKNIRFEFLSALRRGVKRNFIRKVSEETIARL